MNHLAKPLAIIIVTLLSSCVAITGQCKSAKPNCYVDPAVQNFPLKNVAVSHSFQFISHGRPGALYIAGKWRNAEAIAAFIENGHLLTPGTKSLNIYGCSFGKGQAGAVAMAYLKKQLAIDIAASDNVTGKGGDWTLEIGKAKNVLNIPDYQYNLQTICQTVPLTLGSGGTWSTPVSTPSYSPPAACTGTNTGTTTTVTGALDNGFVTWYDSPNGYVWSRTLSGLNSTKKYHVHLELNSYNNGGDARNGYFQNFNLAGITGSYTAPGGSSSSPSVYYDFDVTNKTALSFSGTISAAPYNNCDQAQNFSLVIRISTYGDTVTTYSAPITNANTTTNGCPDTLSNLTGLATGCSGTGVALEWHNANTGYSNSTKLANITKVTDGTYYAICHNTALNCYSAPSAGVVVTNTVCPGFPTPLDFVSVNAAWKQNDAVINWVVALESKNNYFAIERSFNGFDFEEVGKVKSIGDHEQALSYNFTDVQAKQKTFEKVFYRVRQVDLNGQSSTTKVVTLNKTGNNHSTAYIYPTIVKNGKVNFVYENITDDDITLDIRITSADGRSVYSTAKKMSKGMNNVQLETSHFAKGMYYMNYSGASQNINGNMKMIVE